LSTLPPRWDIYCQVVDHFGDAGVLWRLASCLAATGERRVNLWIDRVETLARLVPGAAAGATIDGVAIGTWAQADQDELPDVLVTGFDCAPPAGIRSRMRPGAPLWITVEHLSAESWVERFHGSPSPKADGCVEHFFYPGFVAGTGGLLLEPGTLAARDAALGAPAGDPLRLFAFCYRGSPLAALFRGCREDARRSGRRWDIVVPTPQAATRRSRCVAPGISVTRTPFVPQKAFDDELRRSDLNFVRGEDSWVRALWAARPFVWQAWRQDRSTRAAKLDAFLSRQALWFSPGDLVPIAWLARWWNGLSPTVSAAAIAEALGAVADASSRLRSRLSDWGDDLARRDLATTLVRFASDRAGRPL
jgi:uncharacterized repeat protein (TIGR03837 family)